MKVRGAGPQDAQMYADWLQSTKGNLYDPNVYKYPTCTTLVVEDSGHQVIINSFQATMMVEALAVKPGLDPQSEAQALRSLMDKWKEIAAFTGIKEIYFICADERIGRFVTKPKRGWKKVTQPVYRVKL